MTDHFNNLPVSIDRGRIAAFCHKWGVREPSLFGSVLRDDFGPDSDIDVLVSFAPESDWSYWNWPETVDELESIFGRKVDLVLKEALRNPFRRHTILTSREIIHAA